LKERPFPVKRSLTLLMRRINTLRRICSLKVWERNGFDKAAKLICAKSWKYHGKKT